MDNNNYMSTSSLLSNVQNRSENGNKIKNESGGPKKISWADDKLFVYDDMSTGRKPDHIDKSRYVWITIHSFYHAYLNIINILNS